MERERTENGHEIEIGQEAGYSGGADFGEDRGHEQHEDAEDNGHEIPIGDEPSRDPTDDEPANS